MLFCWLLPSLRLLLLLSLAVVLHLAHPCCSFSHNLVKPSEDLGLQDFDKAILLLLPLQLTHCQHKCCCHFEFSTLHLSVLCFPRLFDLLSQHTFQLLSLFCRNFGRGIHKDQCVDVGLWVKSDGVRSQADVRGQC